MRSLPILALKGGVGKTTTCLGIAHELKQRGNKVGILDVDIHASSLPRALGLKKDPGYDALLGGKVRPVNVDGFQIFSVGLLFPEEIGNMWDGTLKAEAVRQIATTAIAWDDDLDWIVVDTPPTSGDEIQSLIGDGEKIPASLKNIYGAIIVCQPNDLSVLGLAKTLDVLTQTQIPIAGIVANMMGYRCPHCGHVSNPFDRAEEDVIDLARKFNVHYLGSVPFGDAQERAGPIREIVERLLAWPPVTLREKKGGFRKWFLSQVLT